MKAFVKCSYQELMDAGKKVFFPNGKRFFGTKQGMKFGLADFKRQPLTEFDGDVAISIDGDHPWRLCKGKMALNPEFVFILQLTNQYKRLPA